MQIITPNKKSWNKKLTSFFVFAVDPILYFYKSNCHCSCIDHVRDCLGPHQTGQPPQPVHGITGIMIITWHKTRGCEKTST